MADQLTISDPHAAKGPVKIAFITHDTELYGANKSLLNLVEGLTPFGIECYVVAPALGRLTRELTLRNIVWHELPMSLWVTEKSHAHTKYFVKIFRAFRKCLSILIESHHLKKILRGWNVDVVCSNSAVIPVGYLAARRLTLPHIWYLRELCDGDYNFCFDFGKWVTSKIICSSNAVVTVSKFVREHYFGKKIQSNVFVIHNGVISQKNIDKRAASWFRDGTRPKEFTLSLVGLLFPNKGQETAIRAVGIAKIRGQIIRLLIAGSGSSAYSNHLQNLVSSLGLERQIQFLGYVDDPMEVIGNSDALLMCSHAEAMGRVTAEAMVVGRPVIGKASGGTIELVRHNFTGLLYSDEENDLADCICKLASNWRLAQSMGKNAALEGRRKFTIERCASQFVEVLRMVILANEK